MRNPTRIRVLFRPDARAWLGALACVLAGAAAAQDRAFVRERVLAQLRWRSVGPASFGGRVTDLAVDPRNSAVYWVALASGGLFKTTNNGTTFEPIFDDVAAPSVGDVALAPSAPDVVWVGTGEANNQRSCYFGDGVWKSSDAGKTWEHVGLRGTDHIGRIVVDPRNADVAYVAAAGALYTPNRERGLYRTRDGGKTWDCVLFISEDVGFIDVAIDPQRPDTLYAASYERRRRAHHIDESGPGSALWKSTDGGDSWTRLDGGLPSGEIGRIGIDVFAGNPDVVYATVENRNPRPEPADERTATEAAADTGGRNAGAADESRRRLVGGEIYRSDDAGASWRKTNDRPLGGQPGYYYGQIRIDPRDDRTVYVLSVSVHRSTDGGATWDTRFARGLHADHHAMWIDPRDPKHILLGNDGGLASTRDGGAAWDAHNDLPIGQFYAIAVDLRDPYRIYGGTQDNGTWMIPSRGLTQRGLSHADAVRINGGDGFCVCVDPTDPDIVYSETQFGALSRLDLARGTRAGIRPRARRGSPPLRFNWMAPVALSPHNPLTLWFGSQHVHRSRDRGASWETISPDLTTNDPEKIDGNVPHCTITTIAPSPRDPDLLWVGTDDGKVWMTRDGGARWTDLSDRFPGLPEPLWVSRVEASPSSADVAYVAFTGYREDIRAPFLYLTDDRGETFRPIANDLPPASVNVVREHPRNPDVLFAGTELGVQVSLDAGASWHPLDASLPPTPVHDLLVHPRESDLVIGTHGRGLWVLDIAPLEELSAALLDRDFVALRPRDGVLLPRGFGQGYTGARGWTASNPEPGVRIRYYLGRDSETAVQVSVRDATGRELLRREGARRAGLHEEVWDPRGGRNRGGGGRGRGRPSAGPGQYVVRIEHGETVVEHPVWIHGSAGMGELFFPGR